MGLQITEIQKGLESDSSNLLLFIHGLGAADRTWISSKTNWIQLLKDDPHMFGFDVALVRYETANIALNMLADTGLKKFKLFRKELTVGKNREQTNIETLVGELRRELERADIYTYQNIYIVSHSMGGLIGLGYLLQNLENNLEHSIKGFISLATPYNGSDLAVINRKLEKIHPHNQIKDLASNSTFLDELNRIMPKFKHKLMAMCSFAFGIEDKVVSRKSAIPHFIKEEMGIPLSGSHSGIVEVTDHKHSNYIYVRDQILKWSSKTKIDSCQVPQIINNFFCFTSNFQGRASELENIQDFLSTDKKVLITGIAGIGKTQLAIRYLNISKHKYQLICWVRAETRSTMIEDLNRFWNFINKNSTENPYDESSLIDHIRNWMEQNKDYLFIFDNMKSENDINLFLPSTINGDIIVTAQNELINGAYFRSHLYLKPLAKDDSLALLTQLTNYKADKYAQKIVEYFDGLPLSIRHVGTFIYQSKRTHEQFYNLLSSRPIDTKKSVGSVSSTENSFEHLIDIILKELFEINPNLVDFLTFLSFLSSDFVNLDCFRNQQEIPQLATVFNDELIFDSICLELKKYSFINQITQVNTISIHRLLQSALQERLSISEKTTWHQQLTNLFVRLMNEELLVNQSLEYYEKFDLIDHIQALVKSYENKMNSKEFINLIAYTGNYLNKIARYNEAVSLFEYLLELPGTESKDNQLFQASMHINLGFALKNKSNYQSAATQYNKAIRIFEQENHTGSIEFASCLMNFGRLEMDLGQYTESYTSIESALKLAESLLSPDDPYLGSFLNNYGLILQKLNKKQAYVYFIRALKILRSSKQIDNTLSSVLYNNLSIEFTKRRKYGWSILALKKSLEIDIKHLGTKHPVLAYRHDNLVSAYLDTGDRLAAMRELKKAYKIRRKYFDSDHPNMAILFLKYGYILAAKNKFEQAKIWIIRSLNIEEKFYKDRFHIELEPGVSELIKIQRKIIEDILKNDAKDVEYLKKLCEDGEKYVRRSLKINYSAEKNMYLNYFQRIEKEIRKGKIHKYSKSQQTVDLFMQVKEDGGIIFKFLD